MCLRCLEISPQSGTPPSSRSLTGSTYVIVGQVNRSVTGLLFISRVAAHLMILWKLPAPIRTENVEDVETAVLRLFDQQDE